MSIPRSSTRQPTRRSRKRPLLALCVLGACVALAACGSSGSATTSGSNSSSSSAAGKSGRPASSRFTALRSCLQKQGITLPAPPATTGRPGGTPGGGPGGSRGGFQLPTGVTQAQFQAALKKCGGRGFRPGARGAFNSASARAGLVKYAACLRQNGVPVPAPNTSGNGPVFSTKGIDTSSSKFTAAQKKCRSDLKGAFAGGGAAPSGAPPAGVAGGAPGGGPPPGAEGAAG